MKIMYRLTMIHLRQNKKRTLITMFGIIVSVAMITAVGAGYTSVLNFMQEYTIQDTGRWHLEYTGKFKDTLAHDENKKLDMLTKDLGYAAFPQSSNEYKPYIFVSAYDEKAFENLALYLEEGRFAENDSEIVLSKHMMDNGGAPYEVGDKITLAMGNRYVYDENGNNVATLTQENPYQNGEDGSEQETFVENGETKTYTIVGIVSRPNLEVYSAPGYSVFTFLDTEKLQEDTLVHEFIYFNHVNSEQIDAYEGKEGYTTNYSLLRYYGITRSDSIRGLFVVLGTFLMAIIMVGTVSLIYNAFSISSTDRSKQFGMLASVGATRKQKRNSVLFEAAIMSVICIPLGILSGLFGIGVTFRALSKLFMRAVDVTIPLTLNITGNMVLVIVLAALFTIFISAWIPAKRASRMSAIDAVMNRKDYFFTAKSLKTRKITRNLFGFPGELALKNLKRNKRQYRSLTFSLMITFVLFTTLTTYMNLISKDYDVAMDTSNYDVEIYLRNKEILSDEQVHKLYDAMKEIDGIDEANFVTESYTDLAMDRAMVLDRATKDFMKLLQQKETKEAYGIDVDAVDFLLYGNIYGLDEESFETYISQLGLKKDELTQLEEEPIILVNQKEAVMNGYYASFEMFDMKSGDMLHLTSDEYKWSSKIAAVTDQYPMGIGSRNNYYFTLITTEKNVMALAADYTKSLGDEFMAKDMVGDIFYFTIQNANALEVQEEIEALIQDAGVEDNSYSLYNLKESNARTQSMVTIFQVLADGFVVLISLICIANMCNTISTSFELRRREFAMLKSVGMDPKKFVKMIRYESLFYGLKALLYGIPLSLAIIALLYEQMGVVFYHTFQVPVLVYLIAISGMVIIIAIGMFYSSRKIAKENIMDGLRMQ